MIVRADQRARLHDRFKWLPVADRRHAVWTEHNRVPVGSDVVTLCGERLTKVAVGSMEWLWPTCWKCWETAKTVRHGY